MNRKTLITTFLLLSLVSLVAIPAIDLVPVGFATETVILTIDPDDVESANFTDPYVIDFNRTVSSFTINFNVTASYDSANLTIVAMKDDYDIGMWWKMGDWSDWNMAGGDYNVTSEEFASSEGYGDAGPDPLLNITFYAINDPGSSSGEAVWVNGSETYNAWGWDNTGFDTVWLYKEGSGSIWETPSDNFTVTLSSTVYLGYSTLTTITNILPDLLELAVVFGLLGSMFKLFKFDFV